VDVERLLQRAQRRHRVAAEQMAQTRVMIP
jgi:hypothetical protein